MSKILVKSHQSYRNVVAVCDKELLGKRFEQDDLQLEVSDKFFGGEEMPEAELLTFLQEKVEEDATFNFVGQGAVDLGVKAGIISKDGVLKISDVPYAMALL